MVVVVVVVGGGGGFGGKHPNFVSKRPVPLNIYPASAENVRKSPRR